LHGRREARRRSARCCPSASAANWTAPLAAVLAPQIANLASWHGGYDYVLGALHHFRQAT
jgi:hypothetical protein